MDASLEVENESKHIQSGHLLALLPQHVRNMLFVATAILTVLSLLGILAVYDPFFENFRRLFEFDQEQSISTWYSGALLFISSLLVTIIAQEHILRRKPYARHWFYLSMIFMLMSLDEVAGLHEQLIQFKAILNTSGLFNFAWVIPGIFVVIFFAIAYLKFTRDLPPEIRRMFVISLGLFIFGALIMEMLNGLYLTDFKGDSSPAFYIFLTTIEEFFEKIGIILFISTMLTYLRDYCTISVRFN